MSYHKNTNVTTLTKLEDAAQRILKFGKGEAHQIFRAASNLEYHSDFEEGTVEIIRAVVDFRDERIIAFIEPDGTLTVKQNWSEVGEKLRECIVMDTSQESQSAYRKIAKRLDGKIPHPPVEWTIQRGPWCVARMNNEIILEAGAGRNYRSLVIRFSDGRVVDSFREAEQLMDKIYYPQYLPISLEPARRQMQWAG